MARPRESIPEKEELIELGKDLLEWASETKLQKNDMRMRYCDWFCIKHGFIREQWKLMLQKPEFRPYYEQAQSYLGNKWINSEIDVGLKHRFMRSYCAEVKEEENEKALFEAGLQQMNNNTPSPELQFAISKGKDLNGNNRTEPQANQEPSRVHS
jgi:hypothetical protein